MVSQYSHTLYKWWINTFTPSGHGLRELLPEGPQSGDAGVVARLAIDGPEALDLQRERLRLCCIVLSAKRLRVF